MTFKKGLHNYSKLITEALVNISVQTFRKNLSSCSLEQTKLPSKFSRAADSSDFNALISGWACFPKSQLTMLIAVDTMLLHNNIRQTEVFLWAGIKEDVTNLNNFAKNIPKLEEPFV